MENEQIINQENGNKNITSRVKNVFNLNNYKVNLKFVVILFTLSQFPTNLRPFYKQKQNNNWSTSF